VASGGRAVFFGVFAEFSKIWSSHYLFFFRNVHSYLLSRFIHPIPCLQGDSEAPSIHAVGSARDVCHVTVWPLSSFNKSCCIVNISSWDISVLTCAQGLLSYCLVQLHLAALQKLIVTHLVSVFIFVEPEGSLTHSQNPASRPRPEWLRRARLKPVLISFPCSRVFHVVYSIYICPLFCCISCVSPACCVFVHFTYPNNIWWRVQIMRFLYASSSPFEPAL
jgi:hypothetical protein